MGKVKEFGPHAGFIYWLPLSQRYGLQMNARLYYTAAGATTFGEKADPSVSYQFGLLGSYRISTTWLGYAGYAFRRDEAAYKGSNDSQSFAPGQTNTISIQGHYLNLILEYSF